MQHPWAMLGYKVNYSNQFQQGYYLSCRLAATIDGVVLRDNISAAVCCHSLMIAANSLERFPLRECPGHNAVLLCI